MSVYYAHTPNVEGRWHELTAHLQAVAEQARAFAEKFGAGDLAYYAGLWHDLGKFNPQFQQYLLQCANQQPAVRIPHSIHGAWFAFQQGWQLLAFIIAGHHAGMLNRADLMQRLQQPLPNIEEVICYAKNALPKIEPNRKISQVLPPWAQDALSVEMLIRMLFSCLVDADFLDTERHFEPARAQKRALSISLQALWHRFEENQHALMNSVEPTLVNRLRCEIYEQCLEAADKEQGIYRLTVPTGGGKTRSALAFALKHALRHHLERVIVALPYTSIIDQTAEEYRAILGEEMVLEHHSAIDWDDWSEDALNRQRLLAENWDAPVIVTTFVQLFESLLSNRPSACRKLHRIARSVLILDEAQTLPVELLEPTISVLETLVRYYGCTVVICTATQPALEHIGFTNYSIREIVPDPSRYFEQMRRVNYHLESEPISHAEVAKRVNGYSQVMVVLNSRSDALTILDCLSDVEDVFHLSTLLCPAHRRVVLQEARRRLQAGEPCRLIATQVVEAGVDIDFPVVMRAIGPLDRVVQAAGRCNREGRLSAGEVIIFELKDGRAPAGAYRTGIDEARIILSQRADLHAPQTYIDYFRRLYSDVDRDREQIQQKRCSFAFAAVAEKYKLIRDATRSVVVPYAQCEKLLEEARDAIRQGRLLHARWHQKLQPYMVSLYERDYRAYQQQGVIEEDAEIGLPLWRGEYDPLRGIKAQRDPADLVV